MIILKYIFKVICVFVLGLVSTQNALDVERSESKFQLSKIEYQLSETKTQLLNEKILSSSYESQLSETKIQLDNEKKQASIDKATLLEQEQTIQNLRLQPKEVSYTDENGNRGGTIKEIPK